MRLLPYFDGRPIADIVNQIVEKEGLRFTDELLRRLVDFNILVPAYRSRSVPIPLSAFFPWNHRWLFQGRIGTHLFDVERIVEKHR